MPANFIREKSGLKLAALAALLVTGGCGPTTMNSSPATAPSSGRLMAGTGIDAVDGARIANADSEPGNWMSTGRTYSEQRFSPLKQVTDKNIAELGVAWFHDLSIGRGQEATPIVVDGLMFVSQPWSRVTALDAKTGKFLWEYDPEVKPEIARNVCCDVVNRGVAVWKGKVFVGVLDGRLVALDAKTGKEVWSTQTTDPTQRYSITGAPRVVKGKVIIGNSGAEYNMRGYTSAYDAETGKMVWRFYIVPGDPSKPDNQPSDKPLEIARATWAKDFWKTTGGGGTPWDTFVYDPELDLLYIGAGNGGPHNREVRSPGGGDNLFLGSIIAVRPDTGEYVWHFQETPGDSWDFTSVQQIILADIPIEGKTRKVILHAPKNGFFYVIDRETGKFISGKNFVPITWAQGLDANGRPVVNPEAWYKDKVFLGAPAHSGAHNWNPMSYSPLTGLVYIPAQETPNLYFPQRPPGSPPGPGIGDTAGQVPDWKGYLLAWDPIRQKEAWRATPRGAANGGTLVTAGNIVFESDVSGIFHANAADTGKELWTYNLQSAAMGGPISYTVDGEQYVAAVTGLGSGRALIQMDQLVRSGLKPEAKRNISRVVALKLGAKVSLPTPPPLEKPLTPPLSTADQATIVKGGNLYAANCSACHGRNTQGGLLPDLRYTPYLSDDGFYDIVLGGALKPQGMVPFEDRLSRAEVDQIRAYLISQANALLKSQRPVMEDRGELGLPAQ